MTPDWSALEISPVERPRIRIHPESTQDLFLQLSAPDRCRELALDLPADTPTQQIVSLSTTALGVAVRRHHGTFHEENSTVTVQLRDPDLSVVFDALITDVAAAVAAATTASAGVTILRERLAHWTELFRQLGKDQTLDRAHRLGLFGELHTLTRLIGVLDVPTAINSWTGPDRANQDFQLPAAAIEVKTSASTLPHRLVVPNEKELDPSGTAQLILIRLNVDEHHAGTGTSLREMVAAVRSLTVPHPPALAQFLAKLTNYGYQDSAAYDHPRYSVRSVTQWLVAGDFPRITAADLRPGVGDVRYSIDPTGMNDNLVTADQFEDLL